MTYGYSVTEQGMSQQIYESYVELRGEPPPKGASPILAKQIEAVVIDRPKVPNKFSPLLCGKPPLEPKIDKFPNIF